MKIDLYNQNGEKKAQIELNSDIFGQKINHDLIHQYLIYQQSNGRYSIAHTKTKGDVRGGGRKPYKQKGTGRARQGSTRNPHMRGGGVAFGPRNTRNFSKRMPQKQRRKALLSLLSAKAQEKNIIGIDTITLDAIKTKEFTTIIKKLPIKRKVLIVLAEKNEIIQRSSNNIPNIKTILVNYLNPADLLKYESLLFLEKALTKLETIFLEKTGLKKTIGTSEKLCDVTICSHFERKARTRDEDVSGEDTARSDERFAAEM